MLKKILSMVVLLILLILFHHRDTIPEVYLYLFQTNFISKVTQLDEDYFLQIVCIYI